MSGCFPAPAVISGAAVTQIVWGRRKYPVSQFSFCSSTSSWLVYNHSKHHDRRRRRWLPISEERRAGFGVGVSLQQQCDCESESENEGREDNEWVVVNFYQFVMIEDAEGEVAKHLRFLEGLDIRGRIYVNEQGINAQVFLLLKMNECVTIVMKMLMDFGYGAVQWAEERRGCVC